MAAQVVGSFTDKKGRKRKVKWDATTRETYVDYSGWLYVGKARDDGHAVQISRDWVEKRI